MGLLTISWRAVECHTIKKPGTVEYCFANVDTLSNLCLVILCYTFYSYTGFVSLP